MADENHSILGMVLMGDDGLLPFMPLVEVTSWEVKSGFRGRIHMDVTIQCVGILELIQLISWKPICMGKCVEVNGFLRREYGGTTSTLIGPEEERLMTLAKQLASEIEDMVHNRNGEDSSNSHSDLPQNMYDRTYQYVLHHNEEVASNDNMDKNNKDDEFSKLTAISWAALSCIANRSKIYHPSTINPTPVTTSNSLNVSFNNL
eukprot:15340992-Ditylum_brightwellii.AAC.2